MYRAVTWHFLRSSVPLDASEIDIAQALESVDIALFEDGRVVVNGVDVTTHIRSHEVESRVSTVSAIPGNWKSSRVKAKRFGYSRRVRRLHLKCE